MLKIGIIYDHKLMRKSLTQLIDSLEGSAVVIDVANYDKFYDKFKTLAVDLLVVHLKIWDKEEVRSYLAFRSKFPFLKMLIISEKQKKQNSYIVGELVGDCILCSDSDLEDLKLAIQSLRSKRIGSKHQAGGECIALEIPLGVDRDVASKFSRRELDIVKMACMEFNSMQIADKLSINVRTVENHRKNIMEKTNSKNFIGAIVFALRHNLILMEDL